MTTANYAGGHYHILFSVNNPYSVQQGTDADLYLQTSAWQGHFSICKHPLAVINSLLIFLYFQIETIQLFKKKTVVGT